jgi:hypothetical protein
MPQTLLALAALLAFSFYNLSQHSATSGVERNLVGGELEAVASGLARSLLLDVTRRAFDEADAGRDALRTATAGLTPPADLGPDDAEATAEDFDDIDDFDGFAETRAATWDGGAVAFAVAVEVRYVAPAAPSSGAGSATLAKEVTVTVAEAAPGAARPPAVCTLRHVLTPAWKHFHG